MAIGGRAAVNRHGIRAVRYRELVELHRHKPLVAPSVSRRQEEVLRRRMLTDKRIKDGMRRGQALARSGELQAQALDALAARPQTLARREQRTAQGRSLGERRGGNFRAMREVRARALGFAGVDDFLRRRYAEGARIDDLAADLGASWTAVREDMRRAGITARPHSERRRSTSRP